MNVAQDKRTPVRRLERYLSVKRRWYYDTPEGGLRSRIVALLRCRRPWWDWGHRLMIVVGRAWCGNWSPPQPPTIWYRWELHGRKHRWRVVRSYDEYRAHIDAGNEDDWKAIWVNDDGNQLNFGYYESGGFYGLTRSEVPILVRYLIRWLVVDQWFGLRGWLYYKGLHAAVYERKPFSCQQVPPKDSGGYDHWLCQEKRHHTGPHRFRNARWDATGILRTSADIQGADEEA